MRPLRHRRGVQRTALPPRTVVDAGQASGLSHRGHHRCGTAPESHRLRWTLRRAGRVPAPPALYTRGDRPDEQPNTGPGQGPATPRGSRPGFRRNGPGVVTGEAPAPPRTASTTEPRRRLDCTAPHPEPRQREAGYGRFAPLWSRLDRPPDNPAGGP